MKFNFLPCKTCGDMCPYKPTSVENGGGAFSQMEVFCVCAAWGFGCERGSGDRGETGLFSQVCLMEVSSLQQVTKEDSRKPRLKFNKRCRLYILFWLTILPQA